MSFDSLQVHTVYVYREALISDDMGGYVPTWSEVGTAISARIYRDTREEVVPWQGREIISLTRMTCKSEFLLNDIVQEGTELWRIIKRQQQNQQTSVVHHWEYYLNLESGWAIGTLGTHGTQGTSS